MRPVEITDAACFPSIGAALTYQEKIFSSLANFVEN